MFKLHQLINIYYKSIEKNVKHLKRINRIFIIIKKGKIQKNSHFIF